MTAAPAGTSSTQWLPVATTATDISTGNSTHVARSSQERVAPNTTMDASSNQPTWKLGIAAYWLTNPGG